MSWTAYREYSIGHNDVMLETKVWSPEYAAADTPAQAADLPPAFVCLHYFGGSSREWQWIAPSFAAVGWQCIAFDARGHGESKEDNVLGRIDYSVAVMAEDAQDVARIEWLEARRSGWILIGHSMGGKTALELASCSPEGIRGLILIAPSPPTPQPMTDQERQEDIERYGDAEKAAQTARKIAVAQLSPEAEAIFVEDNLRTAQSAWLAWDEHGSREDISAVMPQVTVPTLLITGSDDPVIAQDVYQREVAQRLPNLTDQLVIEGGGHLITMTHADIVAAKIKAWIESL